MDDLKAVIGNLCESDYLPEWILALRNNKVLFSPHRNIKRCIKVGNNGFRSSQWGGLCLLRDYCKRGFSNNDVDGFIIDILRKSLAIYAEDKEKDPYKRLDSSFAILDDLLEIALAKVVFIDSIDFPLLVKTYLKSATCWKFSVVHKLFEAKNVLMKADQHKVFYVYKFLAEYKEIETDYDEYLIIDELISRNPYDYYNCAKERFLNSDEVTCYYDLGAFYEYESSYLHTCANTYFSWLKISSKFIDESTLKSDIVTFIKSDSEILNKAGLCLININFEKVGDLFWDNLDLFFSNESFYADLRCVLTSRGAEVFKPDKHGLLIKTFEKATFGMAEGKPLSALKNHIALIFCKNGLEVQHHEETRSDLEYAVNFNKRIYPVSSHRKEDEEYIKKRIWDKPIEEAQIIFQEMSNGSHYYSDVLFESFRQYLLECFPDTFVDHIGKFGYRFAAHMVYYFASDEHFKADELTSVVTKLIGLMKEDDSYSYCLPSLLYAVKKLTQAIGFEEVEKLVCSINYRLFVMHDYEQGKDVVTACINEDLYSYFQLLIYILQKKHDDKYLREVIAYNVQENDCPKLKSLLAYVFPYILSSSKEYALSLADYIFENTFEDKNLSYPMLAISKGLNEEVIGTISGRSDFATFLAEDVEKGDVRTYISIFSQRIFESYLFDGKYFDLVKIQFDKSQMAVIHDCVNDANYRLKTNSLLGEHLERYKNYLRSLENSIMRGFNAETFEIDQLIRGLAQTIVLSNDFGDIAWSALLSLFKHFNNYFSDECVELVKKYKDLRQKEVTQLLDMYFSSYDIYRTYEETLIEVYNLVAKDNRYKKKAKEWKVSLLQKETGLSSKLL